MIKDKLRAITAAVAAIEKQFGQGAVMLVENRGDVADNFTIAASSTGSLGLDRALGIGGWPRGRVVEVFGPESSGKTTLMLHAIAEVQKAGGVCAFIDAEHALDVAYAKKLGVKLEDLLVSQPDCGEQAMEIADQLARTGAVDLIVVDSVAALTPKAEIDGEMGDAHMGLQARLMSQALRKLTAICGKQNTTVAFINQLRHKVGIVFGNPETTCGGNALKFYASVRVDLRCVGQLKEGETLLGRRVRAKVVKNKCAPPYNEAEFVFLLGAGIDRAGELLDAAASSGIVTVSNGCYFTADNRHLGVRVHAAKWALDNERVIRAAFGPERAP